MHSGRQLEGKVHTDPSCTLSSAVKLGSLFPHPAKRQKVLLLLGGGSDVVASGHSLNPPFPGPPTPPLSVASSGNDWSSLRGTFHAKLVL